MVLTSSRLWTRGMTVLSPLEARRGEGFDRGVTSAHQSTFLVFSIFLIWVFHGLSENLGEHFHGLFQKKIGKQLMKNISKSHH